MLLRLSGSNAIHENVFSSSADVSRCEQLDVVLDTTRAACSMDYPCHQFRVTVLDDSASISKHIELLKIQFPNLFYSTRGTRDPSWHKAGNINHGLGYIASLSGGPSEFVAGLDVDMIPERDWLRRLVPHFMRDAKLGLASPNQRFYNIPHGDPLGQLLQFDQLLMVRQLRKDFGNIGLGGGTGWLARRSALESIGGFATDSISEDFLTCVDLMEAGWSVALLDENLQWGLTPDSFNGHTKQIQRWTTAMLSFNKALSGSTRPRNQFAFKVIAEFSTVTYLIGMVLCYFGLPLVVFYGQPMIAYADHDQLRLLISLSFMDFLAQSMHGFLESWTADFNIYCWHEPSHLWHAPLYIAPAMHRWFPALSRVIFGRLAALKPGNSVVNRSSENKCKSPWSRVMVLLAESHVAPHVFVLCSCAAGLVVFFLDVWNQYSGRREMFLYIVTHVGWPPALFLWTSTLSNAFVPFHYALFAPPRPQREDYLLRDEKSLVAYPTAQAKDQTHRRVTEWRLCVVAVYFAFVTAALWWL